MKHYPNLADFSPLNRDEAVEPFGSLGANVGNIEGTPMFNRSSYPYDNYFFHVFPWSPTYLADEPNLPIYSAPRPPKVPRRRIYQQQRHLNQDIPMGWIILAVLIAMLFLFNALKRQ